MELKDFRDRFRALVNHWGTRKGGHGGGVCVNHWQEYWCGLPCPFPGDLPDPGIKPGSSALQADSLRSEPPGKHKIYGLEVKEAEFPDTGESKGKQGRHN